jgi:hypothetical protein
MDIQRVGFEQICGQMQTACSPSYLPRLELGLSHTARSGQPADREGAHRLTETFQKIVQSADELMPEIAGRLNITRERPILICMASRTRPKGLRAQGSAEIGWLSIPPRR